MPRALVIGGGVAGPAAAMFLAADGWEVEIFEAAANPDDYAGAFLNVATNGLRCWTHLTSASGCFPMPIRPRT
jgi:2-polyprenyl-6-methoxyphenol hydroxylase-like FAD-dependent oxidoreductase